MSQQFVKGRTNNHLTWVMVDATDFATPESALSAATKIKIYGKVRGATGVNFVSSGAGSLTNDIQHVGASALGIYTIALAKADLSDASNAWYDQYIVSLSATGAAYQVLVVDGGIDASAISAYQSRLSDILSQVVLATSAASDAASAAVVGASRILLVQSRLSDFNSAYVSDISDIISQLTVIQSAASDAASAAAQGNSRVLLVQSRLSDLDSRLASDLSDALSGTRSIRSALIGHEGSTASATGNASTLDIDGIDHDDQFNGYWVKLINWSQIDELRLIVDTDATNSRLTVKPAFKSAVASGVDFVIVAGAPYLSNVHSDLRSYLVGMSGMLSDAHSAAILAASNASEAQSQATLAASRVLLVQSRLSDFNSAYVSDLSDLRSYLSDIHSDLKSAIGNVSVTITASDISDIASAVVAALPITSTVSDIYSMLSDFFSDFQSRVPKRVATDSQLSDLMSDAVSDLKSFIGAGVPLDASSLSDIRSAVAATELDASDLSDIASAVWAAKYTAHSGASSFGSLVSDIYSRVVLVQSAASDAASAAQQANSRVLVAQSQASDIYSLITAGVPLDASTMSDLRSAITATELDASDLSDIASAVRTVVSSDLSDIISAVGVANSRVLLNQSRISDVYSAIAAGVEIGASSLSDLRSAITANGMQAAGADPTAVVGVTASYGAKVDWLAAMSRNKIKQTTTEQTLFQDDGTTVAGSATVADDGSFLRSEWS